MLYTIKIEAFEGPFDLLFHLIEKNEIDIYDIPIHDITDQYLRYIYEMEQLNLDITSEFLVMAATLIEIKSKMLLPQDVLIDEGEVVEEIDPRDELVKKLLEYKKYKAVTEEFKQRETLYTKLYFKKKEEIIIEGNDHDYNLLNIKITDLIDVFDKLLKDNIKKNRVTDNNFIREINRDPVTIEKKSYELIARLKQNKKINFFHFFNTSNNKLDIVVTFLALLELIKLKRIKVDQSKSFDDIFIELIE